MLKRGTRTLAVAVRRRGTNTLTTLVIASLTALCALVIFLVAMSRNTPGVADLFIYCAAGMRYPMDEIVKNYKQEYGVDLQVQYGGSNTLLSQLEVSKSGDLYLAADESYIHKAQQQGLAREVIPVATMRPVIAIRRDAKQKIHSVDDLLQPGLRIACGNPDAAAIGKSTKSLLEKSQHWSPLVKQINKNGVFKPTVNEVANDVKLGSVDAGIIAPGGGHVWAPPGDGRQCVQQFGGSRRSPPARPHTAPTVRSSLEGA